MQVLFLRAGGLLRGAASLAVVVAGFACFTPSHVSLGLCIAVRISAVFLILGAAVGFFGYTRNENRIEILAYPLLVNAMGALSLSVFLGGIGQEPRMVMGLLLAAFTSSLMARYRDLQALIRFSDEVTKGAMR